MDSVEEDLLDARFAVLNPRDVPIDKTEVYRYLGYGKKTPSESISRLIDTQVERISELIDPVYTYLPKKIHCVQAPHVYLNDSLVFNSETVSFVMSPCRIAVVFLVTLGSRLDTEITSLSEKGQVLQATILDAVGSAAVEGAANRMEDEIKHQAEKKGCESSLRYSPGYCDWDITQQKVLFLIVDAPSVGVQLTESCLMIPRKSVSGIIGIGKFDKASVLPCRICRNRTSCLYRPTIQPGG